jgi:hypothetical protein
MCVLIGPKKSSRRARTPLPVPIRHRDQDDRPDQDENGLIHPDLVESPESGNGGRRADSLTGAERGEVAERGRSALEASSFRDSSSSGDVDPMTGGPQVV